MVQENVLGITLPSSMLSHTPPDDWIGELDVKLEFTTDTGRKNFTSKAI